MCNNKSKTRIEKVMEIIEYHKWYRYCKVMNLICSCENTIPKPKEK